MAIVRSQRPIESWYSDRNDGSSATSFHTCSHTDHSARRTPSVGQLQLDQAVQPLVRVLDGVQFRDLPVERELHVAPQRFVEHFGLARGSGSGWWRCSCPHALAMSAMRTLW